MCDKFDGSEVTPENKNKMIKAIHKIYRPIRFFGGFLMYLNGICVILIAKMFMENFNSRKYLMCFIFSLVIFFSLTLFKFGNKLYQRSYKLIKDIDLNKFHCYKTKVIEKLENECLKCNINKEIKDIQVRFADYDKVNKNDKIYVYYFNDITMPFIIKEESKNE